jgi:hypothetical protein
MAKMHAEFENGWHVLVHLPPRDGVQEGIVGGTGTRRVDSRRGLWVWVNIDGHWFLVPEKDVEHKTDEPYCLEFVKELQQASLVQKRVKLKGVYVERERIVTPTYEKGFLKPLRGAGWQHKGAPVNRLYATLLDETYKRLTTQAASAGA